MFQPAYNVSRTLSDADIYAAMYGIFRYPRLDAAEKDEALTTLDLRGSLWTDESVQALIKEIWENGELIAADVTTDLVQFFSVLRRLIEIDVADGIPVCPSTYWCGFQHHSPQPPTP